MRSLSKFFCAVIMMAPLFALGQRTEDPIEYFTDDKVRDTRFSFEALYAPEFSSRRLALYQPIKDGNEIYSLNSEDAKGVYGQRMGMMMYYELREMFHLGIGFTTENAGFITRGFTVFDQNALYLDTIATLDATTKYQAVAIPFQMVFHTQMTDIWALQVVPSYDLIFMQKIDRTWESGAPNYSQDAVVGALGTMYTRGGDPALNYHSGFNGSIGFAMGNEFTIANNLAFILKGEFRLGMLPVNKADVGLREIPYSLGLATGFRYYL